jgi:hypothetical protein
MFEWVIPEKPRLTKVRRGFDRLVADGRAFDGQSITA